MATINDIIEYVDGSQSRTSRSFEFDDDVMATINAIRVSIDNVKGPKLSNADIGNAAMRKAFYLRVNKKKK